MTATTPGSVSFRNIGKVFGSFNAIDDLSLEIEPGQLMTLLGPSGCGKTTTLRMLAGLETPTAGRILIGGRDVTRLPANERDVSMVFQSYALFPHMNVIQNVSYGLESSGTGRAEARDRAQRTLDLVGLDGFAARLPAELSGGQQQRVAVARSLVLEPQVLLLDEPLSNLDARLRRKVRTDIRNLQQRLGFTAVYVTHDKEEALAVSDTIVVMEGGRIAQHGPPRELYEMPRNAFVADFISESNLLDCEVVSSGDGRAEVRVGGLQHGVRAGDARPGPGRLAVRPTAIVLEPAPSAPFAGRVESAAYLGEHTEYEVATEQGKLFVVDPGAGDPIPPQSDVALTFRDYGVVLIDA